MNFITDYFWSLAGLTNEMSPYLLLGFIFAGILHVFFPGDKIDRLLGKNNFNSVLKATLIGIPLPLCSCGVIPTGVSFYKHGASKSSTVSFLISTPQTGIDSVMVTWSLIGLPFAIIRVVVALVTGIFGGLITGFTNKVNGKEEKSWKIISENKTEDYTNPFISIFRYAFIDFIKDIAKWLIIGLLIAALISVLVPDDFFTRYMDNTALSLFVILLVSVPLYVCATGSVPIAAALLMKGLSPGAALVFLMAGPATNAATITVIGKVLGKRTLFAYLFSIIGGALFFGFLTDMFFTKEFVMGFVNHNSSHVHNEIIPIWLQVASSIILVMFLLNAILQPLIRKIKIGNKNSSTYNDSLNIIKDMKYIELSVKGMNCNHCKMSVENGLKQIHNITDVNADIANEKVTVTGDNINLDEIKTTVEALGYKYGGEIK